jgi:hypothetical protein
MAACDCREAVNCSRCGNSLRFGRAEVRNPMGTRALHIRSDWHLGTSSCSAGNSELDEEMLASTEGLCFMESVNQPAIQSVR